MTGPNPLATLRQFAPGTTTLGSVPLAPDALQSAPLAPDALQAVSLAPGALQSGGEVEVTLHTGLVVFGLGVVAALLGLYISYQAYRGYRRNQSRPMLYLSAGIVLLTFVPSVLSTLAANLPVGQQAGLVVGMVSRIAGLCSILYAINYA